MSSGWGADPIQIGASNAGTMLPFQVVVQGLRATNNHTSNSGCVHVIQVDVKGVLYDLVTEVDKSIERTIQAEIRVRLQNITR